MNGVVLQAFFENVVVVQKQQAPVGSPPRPQAASWWCARVCQPWRRQRALQRDTRVFGGRTKARSHLEVTVDQEDDVSRELIGRNVEGDCASRALVAVPVMS
jgi:hypothetical protein